MRLQSMARVEIYTTPLCPFCIRAKRLLGRKGVTFEEIDLWQSPGRREEMLAREIVKAAVAINRALLARIPDDFPKA